jgi:hypothetical protein
VISGRVNSNIAAAAIETRKLPVENVPSSFAEW